MKELEVLSIKMTLIFLARTSIQTSDLLKLDISVPRLISNKKFLRMLHHSIARCDASVCVGSPVGAAHRNELPGAEALRAVEVLRRGLRRIHEGGVEDNQEHKKSGRSHPGGLTHWPTIPVNTYD